VEAVKVEAVADDAGRSVQPVERAAAVADAYDPFHFCLGAALARLEARVAFEVLTEQLPSLRLAPGREIRFVPKTSFRGPVELEVEWDV